MKGHAAAVASFLLVALGLIACGGGGGDEPANVAPVANAGPDQGVVTGSLVTLDGSGSSDANGDALSYAWSFTSRPAGSTAALSSATAVAPTFTADVAGSYLLSLTVNDGTVSSAPDSVTIAAVDPAHVPDTGQTASYTATFGEDADYTTNPPSYAINGDGTVTDQVTHLVWQRQDDGTLRQWAAASAYCAGLALPGSGWRVPTPFELITIANYGRSNPSIDTGIFTGTKSAFYWSTDTTRSASDAWMGEFYNGSMGVGPKSASGYVRCVRGGDLVSVFADNGNGTVTDGATNLTWQRQDDGVKRTWEQALTYCEALVLGGASDWRLPNVKELASIEDFTRYPVSNLTFFPATQENYYWSSTTDADTGMQTMAWQASFLGGSVGYPGLDKTTAAAYVRCVRGQ